MYEINKLLHGQGACTGFSDSLFVSEISLARCACSFDFWYITNSWARLAHEVISIFKHPRFLSVNRMVTRTFRERKKQQQSRVGHQGEIKRQKKKKRKKAYRSTYNIFSIKRLTSKIHVVVVQDNGNEMSKKKVLHVQCCFLLISWCFFFLPFFAAVSV